MLSLIFLDQGTTPWNTQCEKCSFLNILFVIVVMKIGVKKPQSFLFLGQMLLGIKIVFYFNFKIYFCTSYVINYVYHPSETCSRNTTVFLIRIKLCPFRQNNLIIFTVNSIRNYIFIFLEI